MDYESIVSEIERLFKDTKFATLATADKSGAPAIGQMCLISDGLTIYMQTYDRFEKVGNIRENPYVAINIGKSNFKGTAQITGHPSANAWFVSEMEEKLPLKRKQYTDLPDQLLIKITLTSCRQWRKFDDAGLKVGMLCVDFVNKTVDSVVVDRMEGDSR